MKIEFLETTKLEPNPTHPIIAKVDKLYSNDIGEQIQKQVNHFNNEDHTPYKFSCNVENFLLEGCWLQNVNYDKKDYIELTILYDDATETI